MDVGRVVEFALVDGLPPIPFGVLCLAELNADPLGLSAFAAISRGQFHSLSLGNLEVSLTSKPVYPSCKIVGWASTPGLLGRLWWRWRQSPMREPDQDRAVEDSCPNAQSIASW